MSGSGFRGRGFGPRGARSNGPASGFAGPRFPHPNFNHPRAPPNRVPGPENWGERPGFIPWQANANFSQRPPFRGNLKFRPNGRGRVPNGRGIIRFSGPGRPPAPQFHMGFVRNPRPRVPISQEEQIQEKSVVLPQVPMLGSAEERQQKITETVDKLKQKLSAITEEDLTNFWEDDLSLLANPNSEADIQQSKGIPEHRLQPPELDIAFNDFKNIGRIDANNSKFEKVENSADTSDVIITFDGDTVNEFQSTNDETTIVSEVQNKPLDILKSVNSKEVLNQPDTIIDEDIHQDHVINENITESTVSSNLNDNGETFSNLNLNESVSGVVLTDEEPADLNNREATPISINIAQTQDIPQTDFLPSDIQDDDNVTEVNPQEAQDTSETNVLPQNVCETTVNVLTPPQINLSNSSPSSEEVQSNTICDPQALVNSSNNEVHKPDEDKQLHKTPEFQQRNLIPHPRFGPKISGPRCRWMFPHNGKNTFFRGPQRLPIHGNRMPPPRHAMPFNQTDLVPFDSCVPTAFTHKVPVLNHTMQHPALLSFPSNDLPLSFDPSEPPPNVRPIQMSESSSGPEGLQSAVPPFNPRSQTTNVSSSGTEILQAPPVFHHRAPPPKITSMVVTMSNEELPTFNPQQPPPKIHKQDTTLQPPAVFDPRISHKHSNLMKPMESSGSNTMSMNVMETPLITDFTSSFTQLPPMTMHPPQSFMPNMQMNYPSVLPHNHTGQDYILPPSSHIHLSQVPPLPPDDSSNEKGDFSHQQGSNMEDGLEDMQEAMEFAKQVMNMTGEVDKSDETEILFPELSPIPLEIPVPNENPPSLPDCARPNVVEKPKEKESKSKKIVYGPEPMPKILKVEQSKSTEKIPLIHEQIRPKVMFNLHSKLKKITKPDDWHKSSLHHAEFKDTHRHGKEKSSKKHADGKKNNFNRSTNQKKHIPEEDCPRTESTKSSASEKSNEKLYHTDPTDKPLAQSSNTVACNNTVKITPKSKKHSKKDAPTTESSWKSRVINRFLKMSKNDICNMVNNSSLRKFDIAMKHLVKERRSSLSLELRNNEDEKMKEYDREEFMTQLNAMLDPGAVVGITDLPTEFIHHLSEVLQLDPMPFDAELHLQQENPPEVFEEPEILQTYTPEPIIQEDVLPSPIVEDVVRETTEIEHEEHSKLDAEDKSTKTPVDEEDIQDTSNAYHPLNIPLELGPSQEKDNSSQKSPIDKSHSEIVVSHKKQQPLFNDADLDNLLSEVNEKTKSIPKNAPVPEVTKSSVPKYRAEIYSFKCSSPQIRIPTATDLDDIFSAGIARARLSRKSANLDRSRSRKSTSKDRSTCRLEKHEKWSRKEREDPDAFRNLTKEEWEAKYGRPISTSMSSTIIRRSGSNSSENLSRERQICYPQRLCSSDSPMRHLSMSPLSREPPADTTERCFNQYNDFEENRSEQSRTSSESSTCSSSDSSEDTVAPDVSKLLKVIKEKEKIAKKRSLNETIRDEVAAEIERTWKEKSKHKERKCRKREKRKREKKEKRKRDRKKKRKRTCQSDASRTSESTEGQRLLTEDEIKKEVIVKEEPVSSNEEIASTSRSKSISIVSISSNKTNESVSDHNESQNPQIERQEVPATSSLVKSKPPPSTQPKTKAQLKQMPEAADIDQKQIMEVVTDAAITSANTVTSDNEKTNETVDKTKNDEVTNKNRKEQIEKVGSTNNNSLQKVDVSLSVELASSKVISVDKFKQQIPQCTTLNTEKVEHQHNDRIVTTSTPPPDNKSTSKKIDIKMYKQRALERRLKEEAKLSEASTSPVTVISEVQHSPVTKRLPPESIVANDQQKSVKSAVTKGQQELRVPDKTKLTITPMKKVSLEDAHQSTNTPQKDKELSHIAKRANEYPEFKSKEKSVYQTEDTDSSSKNSGRSKAKTDSRSSSLQNAGNKVSSREPTISKLEADKSRIPTKIKHSLEEKISKKMPADCNRFKNIRSEGSKELKLKEKIKSTKDKSRKSKKSSEDKPCNSNFTAKHIDKHSSITEVKHSEEQTHVATQRLITHRVHTIQNKPDSKSSSHERNSQHSGTTTIKQSLPEHQITQSESSRNLEDAKRTEERVNNETSNVKVNVTSTRNEDNVRNKESGHDKIEDHEESITKSLSNSNVSKRNQTVDKQNIAITNDTVLPSNSNEQNSIKDNQKITLESSVQNAVLSKSTIAEEVNKEHGKVQEDSLVDLIFNNNHSPSVAESVTHDKIQDSTECFAKVSEITSENSSKNCTKITPEERIDRNYTDVSKHIATSSCASHAETNANISNNISSTNLDVRESSLADTNNISSDSLLKNETPNERSKVECRDLQMNDVRSPDSSGSPFKGFVPDSIEDDIREVSKLLTLEIKERNLKENAEHDKKEVGTCTIDNFNLKEIDPAQLICKSSDNNHNSSETCSDRRDHDNCNDTSKNDVSTAYLKENERNKDPQENTTVTDEVISSPIINTNSQEDSFDEDSEPFIVLDEYIDDTDARSVEKLSAINLDLEDCIARDADVFQDRNSLTREITSMQDIKATDLNAIHFKVLSEVADKDDRDILQDAEINPDADIALQSSEIEKVNEDPKDKLDLPTLKPMTENSKLVESIVSDIPLELNEKSRIPEKDALHSHPTSKDNSQGSVIESLYTEIRKTEQQNLQHTNKSEHNVKSNLDAFTTIRLETVLPVIDTPKRLHVPTKAALKKSADNLVVTPLIESTSERNIFIVPIDITLPGQAHTTEKKNDTKIPIDSGTLCNPIVELEKSKELEIMMEKKQKLWKRSDGKSSDKGDTDAFHKVKNKPKMKHKQEKKHNVSEQTVKDAVESDTVQIGYPNTKESIMARMIEIDVEIHKLMTEKMTLYEMLKSGALSQLIQNIETGPSVSNQGAKGNADNASHKDNTVNSLQINKPDTPSKHEHSTAKRRPFSYSSDDDERTHHGRTTKSVVLKRKKKQRTEGIPKRENASAEEQKQINETKKSSLKTVDDDTTREMVEPSTTHGLPGESKVQSTDETFNQNDSKSSANISKNPVLRPASRTDKKSSDLPESGLSIEECIKFKISDPSSENSSSNVNDNEMKTSVESTVNVLPKLSKSITPEMSSIYSDDSTWESYVQNNGSDDQKKVNTGLALLEETYKKEIAKSRKIKAEARRKKRRQLRNLLRGVNTLTPEEETLPLSALYIQKLQQKKDLLDTLDQKTEESNNDPQIWRNVDEIINAVAENRVNDLYAEQLKQQDDNSDDKTGEMSPPVLLDETEIKHDIKTNSSSKSNQEDEIEASLAPEIINEDYTKCKESQDNNSEFKDCTVNDSEMKNVWCTSPDKLLVEVPTDTIPDIEKCSTTDDVKLNNLNLNKKPNTANLSLQDTVEINSEEISPSVTESNKPCTDVDKNTSHDDQHALQSVEASLHAEEVEEDTEERKVSQSPDNNRDTTPLEQMKEIVNEQKHVLLDIPAKLQNLEHSEEKTDTLKSVESEIVSNIISETDNSQITDTTEEKFEEKSKDLGTSHLEEKVLSEPETESEKIDADYSYEKSNNVSEYFLSVKDLKVLHKRNDSERSNENSSEESFKQVRVSSSLVSENIDLFKNEDLSNRKSSKRKRGSSKTPLRRSSRYTEEIIKRVKLDVSTDRNTQNIEQEFEERNSQVPVISKSPTPSLSHEEETESTAINLKKNRGTQKVQFSRKRSSHVQYETIESNPTTGSNEPVVLEHIKKRKQHTMSQMLNCEVRLVDSKYTILKPDVDPNVLRRLGISVIHPYTHPKSFGDDESTENIEMKKTVPLLEGTPNQAVKSNKKIEDTNRSCSEQSTMIKITQNQAVKSAKKPEETNRSSSEQSSTNKATLNQTVKSSKKPEEANRSCTDQSSMNKIKKVQKSPKVNSLTPDKDDCTEPDTDIRPVLTKTPLSVETPENFKKADVETVEEANSVINKTPYHDDPGPTLSVIEPIDETEIPRTQYTVHKGPILDIKVFDNSFLAASEDGRIYRYSQASNGILNIYKGHEAAVTCLYVYRTSSAERTKEWMFSGSLDGTLRCYNITTGVQIANTADVKSPIQCMDQAWGVIFIGTKSGHVSRYHIKSGVIKGDSIQFSDKSVLALKATNEGARRVLIVASRSQPITIRDAQSGLFLRTICGQRSLTVYSLMHDNNWIYCGTSSTSIPVFDFTNGEQTAQYDAGVGIVCMRLYKKLLFAGCYDGNIYVFDTMDHRLVCSIPGPGNMLLSMEIIDNKIIAGSKDKRLQSWLMPKEVRTLLQKVI